MKKLIIVYVVLIVAVLCLATIKWLDSDRSKIEKASAKTNYRLSCEMIQ